MRKNLAVCLWAASTAVLFSSMAAPAAAEVPLNLLFFGNSFTMSYDIPGQIWQIAQADGHVAPRSVSDLTGGTDIAYHINQLQTFPENNINNPTVHSGDTWDYVIFQGYSTETTHLGNPTTFVNNSVSLVNQIRTHSSGKGVGTRPILYETWARGPGHSFYPTSFTNPAAMQAEVRASYQQAQNQLNAIYGPNTALLAPVGDAYESLNFDIGLYGSDIYHPSEYGATLNALILYRTIYGEMTSDIPYSGVSWFGVTSAQWTELTAIADSTPISVPEPATLTTLALAGLLLLPRKSRARS